MAEKFSGTDSGNAGAGILGAPDPAWVEGAPLRLLAYALLLMQERTGKAEEIKDALQSLVEPSVKWSHWWQQTQEMVKKSDHFKLGSRPTTITLLTEEIDDIPSPQLPPPPLPKAQREWLRWFQGETDVIPSKSGNPVKAAHDALNICPPEYLGTALQCTIRAAGDILDKPTKSAAEGWADLLSNAALRWRSRPDADNDAKTAARVARLMVRLLTVADFPPGKAGHWLCQAGALLDESSEIWRESFAAVLWDALPISSQDIQGWFRKAFAQMMRENQVVIAREIALGAFTDGASPVPAARFSGVDALLSHLFDAGNAAFLRHLVVLGVSGKAHRQSVADYIAHSDSAAHPQKHLDAAALAAILLTDGRGPLAERAGQGIADALDDDSGAGAPSWDVLLSESRRRIAGQRAVLTDQIEELRAARERERLGYENRIAQSDRETARLRAEIAAGREESRLDIRQDMLTVISETLYDLRGRRDSPEELLRLVETRLSLALRAGGAEEFGTIGETAAYDSVQHQADGEIRPGAPVRIAAPGAVVRGKLTGDRVLVKASVVSLAEEESCR